MVHVTRQLTPEQVWIAKLFRSCCNRGKVLNALDNSLHLPPKGGIRALSSHEMTRCEHTVPRASARRECIVTDREKTAVTLQRSES